MTLSSCLPPLPSNLELSKFLPQFSSLSWRNSLRMPVSCQDRVSAGDSGPAASGSTFLWLLDKNPRQKCAVVYLGITWFLNWPRNTIALAICREKQIVTELSPFNPKNCQTCLNLDRRWFCLRLIWGKSVWEWWGRERWKFEVQVSSDVVSDDDILRRRCFLFLLKITCSPSPLIVKSCNRQMLAWQVWTRRSGEWSCSVHCARYQAWAFRKQHLPSALVNSKTFHSPPASFSLWGVRKGWMGKLGRTRGRGGKTVEVFFYRTAEVSVPYLVFGWFYGFTVEIHKR